jgi:hypothetical protein
MAEQICRGAARYATISGFVNPVLTIVAMSVRLARHLNATG